ncbi:uncharacterized protein LOC135201647 [Macrobrachium nipponense]|uniref:uncharacterized protein LOC135201647 n=1 Tax=Macrobrachium nipponense TaxID=159736 RepID=UPI0030C87C90
MGQNACKCPEPKVNALPQNVWEIAERGDARGVRDYLSLGGDVNAANAKGETLLAYAARNGKYNVLMELLKSSYLHLNTYHEYNGAGAYTPLWLAAANGHYQCASALMMSNLSCRIDTIGSKDNDLSAIMIAAEKGNWNIAKRLIVFRKDSRENLSPEEANYIFPLAVQGMQWDIGVRSLNYCSHYDSDSIEQFLNKAVERDYWEVILEVLKVKFRGRTMSILRFLSKSARELEWKVVAKLLEMMPEEVTFDKDLVEAALKFNTDKISQLVRENEYDAATMNGNLLIVAAGGTNEFIAKFLFNNIGHYPQWVVNHVLSLSALNGHLEFLQLLFQKNSDYIFTYSALSVAQKAASQGGHVNADRLLSKILDEETQAFANNYLKVKERVYS